MSSRGTQSSPNPSPSSSLANDKGGAHVTRSLSTILATVTVGVALIYFCALFLVHRYNKQHPRPLIKKSGIRLQQYAPAVYAFIVFTSIAEGAVAIWLLLQFHFNNNSPNSGTRVGIRFLLFSACWTTLTAGTYTLLFIHPLWSKYRIASIGGQAIWVFLTWIFWVSSAAVVNAALPALLTGGICVGLVYCGQLQALFALAVLEILTLTLGMLTILWLAWKSTRSILQPTP